MDTRGGLKRCPVATPVRGSAEAPGSIRRRLGLSREDGVCHLDHGVAEDEWGVRIGTHDTFGRVDDRVSMVSATARPSGERHVDSAMSAMVYVSLLEAYSIAQSSEATYKRVEQMGASAGVAPRALVGFLRTSKVPLLNRRRASGRGQLLDTMCGPSSCGSFD